MDGCHKRPVPSFWNHALGCAAQKQKWRGVEMSRKTSTGTVGVIGLGIMGGSFSRNLLKAGWRVVGFDTDTSKRRELSRAGIEIAGSAQAVAAAAPVIITSLPKPEALVATAKAIAAAGLP